MSQQRLVQELDDFRQWKSQPSPSSSSHSRSSEVPSSVERVLVVKSQLHSVLGVTTLVSEGSPGTKEAAARYTVAQLDTHLDAM